MTVLSRSTMIPAAGIALLALVLVGCVPEPGATDAATPSGSASHASASPSASPTVTTTADDISLPASCESLYSAATLASLNAANPPLNDPGVTMYSTQNAAGLEVLSSGIPTIRCSWGVPSEKGLATNVSIVTAAQAGIVKDALVSAGFACADADGGTLCTFEKESVTLDDKVVKTGEAQLLRGNAWVSTAYVDFFPDGYVQAIAETLWG